MINEVMFPIGKELKQSKDYDPNIIPAFKGTVWVIKEELEKENIWERIS